MPTSLFKNCDMCKTAKSQLAKALTSSVQEQNGEAHIHRSNG